MTQLTTEFQQPAASSTSQLPAAENLEAEWPWQQQSGSVSLLSPFSEAHSSQQLSWQRNDTEWHSFSTKYSMAAFPPPPVATTHEISAICSSHPCPLVTTNKVVFSPQSAPFQFLYLCFWYSVMHCTQYTYFFWLTHSHGLLLKYYFMHCA